MKKRLKLIGVLLIFLIICACGPSKNLVWCPPTPFEEYPQTTWEYEEEAVRIHVQADPKLNFYNGGEHTLNLCFYQLREPNAFNQMVDSNQVSRLLGKGHQFTDGSRTNFQSKTIKPGQDLAFSFPRYKGTKYMGIVAGYYASLEKERVVYLAKIQELVAVKKTGMFKSSKLSKPDALNVELILGPEQITKAKAVYTKCEGRKKSGKSCLF